MDEILKCIKDLDGDTYPKLCSENSKFGGTAKGCIKGEIDKCIGKATYILSLKELFCTLENLGIADLNSPTEKGKFEFSLNDILGDNAGSQIEQLKTNIKTSINASLEALTKTVNNYLSFIKDHFDTARKIRTLLRLLENLGIADLSTPAEKGPFGLSLEDILCDDTQTLKDKMKAAIVETANRLDQNTPDRVLRLAYLREFLPKFGIKGDDLKAREREVLGLDGTPA
ncbi:MAG: hypothetical protein LBQ23_01205 [Puniceicoccales bacterium]|nr:hypothetical protein [Puniceicoccales bacterium]